MIYLCSPWGQTEWTGDWSDSSPLWTARMKAKLQLVDKNDGTFWISFADFCLNFRTVYICRVMDASKWHRQTVASAWRGNSAGGCTNHDSAQNNPQFHLWITAPTKIFLILSQQESRGVGNASAKTHSIGVAIADKKGVRVQNFYQGNVFIYVYFAFR